MVSKVKESSLFGDAAVTVIPNGVGCDTFRPGNKERARASMGLPIDVKIVMFSAANCNNIRKGMRDLLTAVNDLEGCELFLLIVGQGDVSKRIRVRHEQFGYVSDLSKLANLYRAADVFVIPSLEDNMPNTCLEAMASGTPVVGYAAGGIPEMVEDGVHGFLAPPGDAAALSRSIRVMLSEPGLRNNMAIECRKIAVERFSRALQVREYAAWLTKIKQR
jgi:glycosyltransferase involved in cell wall biosynthesis